MSSIHSKKLVPLVEKGKLIEMTTRGQKRKLPLSKVSESSSSKMWLSPKPLNTVTKIQKRKSTKKEKKTNFYSKKTDAVKDAKCLQAISETRPAQSVIKDFFKSKPHTIDLSTDAEDSPVEVLPKKRRKMPLMEVPLSIACPENDNEVKSLPKQNSNEPFLQFNFTYLRRNLSKKADVATNEIITEVPATLSAMFEASMEEGETGKAIDFITSILGEGYPPASAINSIVRSILLLEGPENIGLKDKTASFLLRLRWLYPPTSLVAKQLYLHALCSKKSAWETVAEIIEKSFSREDNFFLFSFVVEILEENFNHFISNTRQPSEEMMKSSSYLLVFDVFWQKRCRVTLNKNCKELLDFFGRAIVFDVHFEVQILLHRLVAIVGDCLRLTDSKFKTDYSSSSCAAFANKLYTVWSDLALCSLDHLQKCLFSLNPVWLRHDFIKHVFSQFAAKIFSISSLDCNNLGNIVSTYMTPHLYLFDDNNTELKPRTGHGSRRFVIQSVSVNKQNCKGETPLHIACAENRMNYLKRLLEVPGINVNIKDNLGWTPLHEACNHGNVDCVNILLKWSNSLKDNTPNKVGVDILATMNDGVSVLHDAVINNHVNVVKVLLKYGGVQLLELVTPSGYTALDLADTEEMKSVLTSLPPNAPKVALSPKKPKNILSSTRISHEDCCRYLLLLGHFLDSYLSHYRIREVAKNLQELPIYRGNETARRDISDAVRKMLKNDDPMVEDVKTLTNDIRIFWEMEGHVKNLESSLESIVGSKNCFKSELTFLEFICLF